MTRPAAIIPTVLTVPTTPTSSRVFLSRQQQRAVEHKEEEEVEEEASDDVYEFKSRGPPPRPSHPLVISPASLSSVSSSHSPPAASPSTPPPLSPSHYSSQRWYQVGESHMQWGHQLREMVDSTPFLSHVPTLRANLHHDGYLLLRRLLPPALVEGARAVVTAALHEHFDAIDTSLLPHTAAALRAPSPSSPSTRPSPTVLLTGYAPVTHHPATLALLESSHLSALLQRLFDAPASTFHTKWVRVMARGERTDEHVDYFRFSGNARGMLTCWLPLGDYGKEHGTLAVCHGSHRLIAEEGEEETTERKEEEERKAEGAEGKGKSARELPAAYEAVGGAGFEWHTTDVGVGDVVVFDIRAIHASTANETDRFRLSMDTRWQPTHLTPPSQREAFKPL